MILVERTLNKVFIELVLFARGGRIIVQGERASGHWEHLEPCTGHWEPCLRWPCAAPNGPSPAKRHSAAEAACRLHRLPRQLL